MGLPWRELSGTLQTGAWRGCVPVALLAAGLLLGGPAPGWLADAVPAGVVVVLMVGTGLGVGCNRLLFGVLRPVPDLRRRQGSG